MTTLTAPQTATLPNIALTGALRSGKSSVSAYLRDKYGYTEFAFGDEMKRFAHEIFNVPQSPKPRELYQWFGETMRQRDPDVWVRKCFEDIRWYTDNYARDEYIQQTPPPVVITDLRLPTEYDRCRSEGYVIIRIRAQSALRIHRAVESADTFNLRDLTHETESHVDKFAVDYEITNDGSLAELYAAVDAIMADLKR
ncbi:adenylate kinase [Paenibacillus abyssi]|uniref:Adenylate kinase n=1 Tax=Paenibacillus abyssi TaxID=1340531 RepID=A0A917CGU3_9BACL|nr:adenylate kinase [Paenibacillus abyssi]GGF88300.1 hypothetical protein GCM10010916_02040 [Paenibacillus abyssi]